MAEDLPPGHSALLLILEHVWASRARELVSSLGGSLVSHEMITQDMLIRLGVKLGEGQEPKEIRK